MSAVMGFCIAERADVPLQGTRYCPRDGALALPPSFGRADQTWLDGAWWPVVAPRVNRTKFAPKPGRGLDFQPVLVTVVCAHCGESAERPRMQQARFCSPRCRYADEQRRKRERKAS